jgi:hypothetical protein
MTSITAVIYLEALGMGRHGTERGASLSQNFSKDAENSEVDFARPA